MGRRVVEKTVCILLILALLFSVLLIRIPVAHADVENELKIIPSFIEVGAGHVDETPVNISVACVIENAQNLYGLDVQISWNAMYLKYVYHTVTMPVEDYPNPIPPSPYNGTFYKGLEGIRIFRDRVNESGGMPLADPDAMYRLSVTERGLAPEFFGNITIFVMNFTVLKQPYDFEVSDYIDTYIHFEHVQLADSLTVPYHLDYTTEDATVRLWSTSKIDFDPDFLNLKSKGGWITSYIGLPEGYNLTDINVTSIMLNNIIPADLDAPMSIGDYDNDTIPDLMVRFNRTAVCEYILSQNITYDNVTLTVGGTIHGVDSFHGSDTITVSALVGDVDCDGEVCIYDIVSASASYGARQREPDWNPNCDFAPPYGKIDLYDIVTMVYHYGETA